MSTLPSHAGDKVNVSGYPADQQKGLAEPLSALEAEAASTAPSQSKLCAALQTIKTVAEGAAGNVVASGIVALISQMLGGG